MTVGTGTRGGRYLAGDRTPSASSGPPVEGAPTWALTEALRRALVCGVAAVVVGLVAGRADVALLGVPLLLGVAVGLVRGRPGDVTVDCEAPTLMEQGSRAEVQVTVTAPGAEVVAVRLPWDETLPHGRTLVVPVPPSGVVRLGSTVDLVGRGDLLLARPDVLALAADGHLVHGPVEAAEHRCIVLPAFDRIPSGPLAARPSGLVGAHRTRYPGDGADLLSVRPFVPGDRLKRMDWRVTARRGEPHVRTTAKDSDADVVLCLDSRIDLGRQGRLWGFPPEPDPSGLGVEGSSLDLAVRVATTIAAAQLRTGDRVALMDLGARSRWVAPGTGRRQLLKLRLRLAVALPLSGGRGRVGLRPFRAPSGAVVVVLSTFIDDVPARVAVEALHQGAAVLAVDVLPENVRPDRSTPFGPEALEAVLTERAERLRGLQAQGVQVLPGHGVQWAVRLREQARARRGRR